MAGYKRNIGSNFITQIINIIASFLTSVLIARALGPTKNGYIAYLLLVFGLIANYGHFGINNATTYFQKRTSYTEKEVFNNNVTSLIIISGLFTLGIIVLKYYNIMFQDYDYILVFLGLVFMLSSFIFTNISCMYIGNERIPELNRYIVISKIIYLLIILILFFLKNITVYTYFMVFVIVLIIKTVTTLRKIGIKYELSLNRKFLKEEISYGKYIYFSALFIFLNYRVDQILIRQMLGVKELGVYSIAVQLAELVFLVPTSIVSALSGKLYNMTEKSKDRKVVTTMTIKYTFYTCFILAIVGLLMTPLIKIVYGNGYQEAASVTSILFIGVVFASIGKVAAPYFFTIGKPEVHLIITFIVLTLNIVLNYILIPFYGINGAAFASTVSYIVYGVLYIAYLKKKEKFDIRSLFYFKQIDKEILAGIIGKIKLKKRM